MYIYIYTLDSFTIRPNDAFSSSRAHQLISNSPGSIFLDLKYSPNANGDKFVLLALRAVGTSKIGFLGEK